jgi:hypothetical protein
MKSQCPISEWADSEIARHSSQSNLGEECNAKIAVPLLKRFKSKLAQTKVDEMDFTKNPKFKSMNVTQVANGDWACSVLWVSQWYNCQGRTFNDCVAKLRRLLK